MTDDGDCFIKNGQVFIDSDIYDFLCHGTAIGRGEIKGIKHKHCWIEKGDVVFDFSNGNEIIIRNFHIHISRCGRLRWGAVWCVAL